MNTRSQDYDLTIVQGDYLEGRITVAELEHQIGGVLNGGRIHEHDWIDITEFAKPYREYTCGKCGETTRDTARLPATHRKAGG